MPHLVKLSSVFCLLSSVMFARGADIPWTTYEAEAMRTNATVLGPTYGPFERATEASHQRAVCLAAAGDYVEFSAGAAANALVLRYSVPDAPSGGGQPSSLELLVNGRSVRSLGLTSRYMHLYGNYPFTNNPADGKHRNFYDELRVKDLALEAGDVVRLQKPANHDAEVVVDLVDLENVAAPLAAPADALPVGKFGAKGDGVADDTAALLAAVAAAQKERKPVWVPAGDYKLTGDIVVPSGVTIQGAGMWHTTFVGDEALYPQAGKRVRFKLAGSRIKLADFAIVGRLNYRNDNEPNDGVVGAGCADSEVARVWIEHTKVGAWIYNGTRLTITGCRFRNLLADGVNFCVGTHHSVVENSTTRGTGDDCFAMWPAASDQGFDGQVRQPGHNVFRRCTGALPFLANGGAIYGGEGNAIEDCLFTDITPGCGVLISSTFPTDDPARGIDNNFSGTTTVRDVDLVRCGGYDHSWAWRGAFQICLDRKSISGLAIANVTIRDSFSTGLTVVAPGSAKGQGTLAHARLEKVTIAKGGLSGEPGTGLWIRDDAQGGLTIVDSQIAGIENKSAHFKIE